MTEKNKLFWDRVLELSKAQLAQNTYEFFVLDARLIKIEQNIVTIYLDPVKELFWDKNLKSIILTAGFEVFNTEITADYIYEEDLAHASNATFQHSKPEEQTTKSSIIPYIDSDLNSKYTFDNFVQGDENRWAFSASYAVADAPGTTYNPLFIYGGPGLGKTHLLNAIGNSVLQNKPQARVKYITAENFINEFVVHIRLDTMAELKEKFRNLDVLLIDDIQSLAKKTLSGTQEEFFNTFNALYDNNKQIVLTSDRTPDNLDNLEDRLVTRFGWGLTINITPPDFETRVAILTNKTQDYNYTFPQDTIEYLAGQFDSNVRELEGALKDISLVASIKNVDIITVDIAAESIRARKQESPKMSIIPIEKIQKEVGTFYSVTVKEIKATKRTQNIVLARQIAMYLSRELTDNSLPKIGKEFGGRDHSTVLHAYNKIKNMLDQDNNLRIEIDNIRRKLK